MRWREVGMDTYFIINIENIYLRISIDITPCLDYNPPVGCG
jgi:hypothetical protein